MLRTSIAARVAALAASAVVHATAFVVTSGHAGERSMESVERTVDVLVDVPDDEPAPMSAPPSPEPRPPDVRPRSHPYPHPMTPGHDGTPHDPAPLPVPEVPAAEAAEARVITAAPDLPVARFTIVVSGPPHVSEGAIAAERGREPGDPDPIAAERATTPARMLTGASPEYPREARAQGIEANVILEIVVDTAGRVRSARVARSAAAGFDGAALTAIRSYRFAPATLHGQPVSVRMRWSVEFQLQ